MIEISLLFFLSSSFHFFSLPVKHLDTHVCHRGIFNTFFDKPNPNLSKLSKYRLFLLLASCASWHPCLPWACLINLTPTCVQPMSRRLPTMTSHVACLQPPRYNTSNTSNTSNIKHIKHIKRNIASPQWPRTSLVCGLHGTTSVWADMLWQMPWFVFCCFLCFVCLLLCFVLLFLLLLLLLVVIVGAAAIGNCVA